MIVVHGETLWSPALQPMDDDDDDDDDFVAWESICCLSLIVTFWVEILFLLSYLQVINHCKIFYHSKYPQIRQEPQLGKTCNHLLVKSLSFGNFWCTEGVKSRHCSGTFFREVAGDAIVGQLHVHWITRVGREKQDVIRLQICMNDAFFMEIAKGSSYLYNK